MIIEHRDDGRTVADTDAMAAVTLSIPWQVRRHGVRGEDGRYDVAASIEALQRAPEPNLVPGSRVASQATGVPDGTIRSWAARKLLPSFDRHIDGRPLYDLDDIRRLAQQVGD